MKKLFVKDIAKLDCGVKFHLKGWIKAKREAKNLIFLDIVDSTGTVKSLIDKKLLEKDESTCCLLKPEASIEIEGKKKLSESNGYEIEVIAFSITGQAKIDLQPNPRCWNDIFEGNNADHMLKNRHFYLRNEKQAAVLRFKSFFIYEIHRYLMENEFVFVDAPILTKLLLYDDSTAFKVDYHNNRKRVHDLFLSQCCTFQLEAAVHAFEKVYNVTPSFRAEHSKSNRHLREYWHLKIEIAWAELDDLIRIAEELLHTVTTRTIERASRDLSILGLVIDPEEITPPYEKITYDDAAEIIRKAGKPFKWGKSLGTEDEKIITKEFGEKLIWVKGMPCSAEGFPFARDKANPRITRTCDLICPHGLGEILGTAEKITDRSELLERMAEKGKTSEEQLERYGWYLDLRDYGMVPHGGIGMGIERAIRFLLKLPHVRYTTSFPRLFGRTPNP